MKYLIFTLIFTLSHSCPNFSQNTSFPIQIIFNNNHYSNNYGESPDTVSLDRPQIGLALSGGGARGLAQIGVLKVFEKNGIRIDAIAGTSIGAIIGGLYAVGYTATEIESLVCQIKWDEIIRDKPSRHQLFLGQKEQRSRYIFQIRLKGYAVDIRSALTSGQKLTTMLSDLVLHSPYPVTHDFDNLHVRYRAVTTDIISGKKVVLKSGSIIEAMRASMAIPLLFTPVPYDSMLLVDGGLVQNLPTSEVKSMNTNLVIAIDTSSKLRDKQSLSAPWEIADQVTTIMHHEHLLNQSHLADLSIFPNLPNISNTDFNQIQTIIQAGEEAAKKIIPDLELLITKETTTHKQKSYVIKDIILCGFQNLDPQSFYSLLPSIEKQILPYDQIMWIGHSILQTGYFHSVKIDIDTLKQHLIYQIEENPIVNYIEIWGNSVFPDTQLIKDLTIQPKKVLNRRILQKGLSHIIKKYYHDGYSLTRIIDTNLNKDILKIWIDEGRIAQIQLQGNTRTRPFVIQRELDLHPGDLFNVSLLKKGIENIYSTGYFESVQFNLDEIGQSHNLSIRLAEQGYHLIRFGTRYDSERKTKAFLEFVEENVLGFGADGSIMGLIGNRDGLILTSIRCNRLLQTYLTTNLHLSFSNRQYNYYENNLSKGKYNRTDFTGSISLGQQMQRFGTLSLTLKSERINLKTKSGITPDESYVLNSLMIQSEIDSRNRFPFPETGKYHLFQYETASKLLNSQVSYTKFNSIMQSFFKWSKRLTYHNKIQWGTSDLTIPYAKKFHMGGLNSFIGLPEHTYSGRRYFILTNEILYKLPWFRWLEAYLSIRYDFGGIWMGYEKLTVQDFKHGIGIGFALNTPLGPLMLSYGRISDGLNRGYLTAGHQFD